MHLKAQIGDNVFTLENEEILYIGIFDGWGFGIQKVVTKNKVPFAKLLIEKSLINNPGYKVFFETGDSYRLKYIGFFKPRQLLKFQEDVYEVFPHRGSRNSIFKNGIQIGYWQTSTLNAFYKSYIDIYIDEDVNIDLVFIFICALDFDLQDEESTSTLNLGNLFQARKFDKEWKPKKL